MNDKQKIVTFLLALVLNFTFLATAGTTQPAKPCKKSPVYMSKPPADTGKLEKR
jgi:hypothetical protein